MEDYVTQTLQIRLAWAIDVLKKHKEEADKEEREYLNRLQEEKDPALREQYQYLCGRAMGEHELADDVLAILTGRLPIA